MVLQWRQIFFTDALTFMDDSLNDFSAVWIERRSGGKPRQPDLRENPTARGAKLELAR
jgi:hypothetical protein